MEDDIEGGFGDSDFSDDGGGSKYVKERSIPEGTSRFRILPPMKSLVGKKDGWRVWGAVHYGYSGVKKNKPDETVQRPFGCVQKKGRDGVVYQTCDACQKHAKYKDEAERHAVHLKDKGLSKDQIKEDTKMEQLNDWLWNHNCDKKWRVAAMEESGGFTILKINFTLMKELFDKFQKLARDPDMPINPIRASEGVWVEFTRSGKNFSFDFVKERVNVPGHGLVEKIKLAPLSQEQMREALARVQDLVSCVSVLSPEQIKMIVNGPQDPESIDSVWALGQSSLEVSPDAVTTPTVVKSYAPATKSYTPPPAPAVDEEAAVMAQLEAIRAKKAAAASIPKSTPNSGVEMTDAEFLHLVTGDK